MKKVLSYGGGLDSFALLVEAIWRGEKPDVVAFVDVADPEHKDPGEWPGTYRHIEEVVRPLCAEHGIELVIIDSVRYPVRDARSLFAWLEARKQIPVAGPNRVCTTVAKVERFERWLTDRYPAQEVEVWIGFEAGEEARADKDPNAGKPLPSPEKIATLLQSLSPLMHARAMNFLGRARRVNRFPLIEWKLCRCRCEALVRAAGYPVPRKSACTCPMASKGDWQTLARELPETFDRVVALEAAKPPTAKNGIKLSIMGFHTTKNPDGSVKSRRAPPLPVFIEGAYKRTSKPCAVCGAAEKATKATGCGYLDEEAAVEAA